MFRAYVKPQTAAKNQSSSCLTRGDFWRTSQIATGDQEYVHRRKCQRKPLGVLATPFKVTKRLVLPGKHARGNNWPGNNHWIGVRLRGAPSVSPIGSKITVRYEGKTDLLPVVTGDSLSAQHSNTKLFGLGQASAVESLEVRWPNGKVTRLKNPAIDRYHLLQP